MSARTSKVLIPLANGETVSGVLGIPNQVSVHKTPAVILGHGAGGNLQDPLLAYLQAFLRARGYLSLRFNFPYREKGRSVPDRESILESTFRDVIRFLREHPQYAPGPLYLAGRSMGGRIASQIMAGSAQTPGVQADGLLLLAYPLHAPGRPERVRDQHLAAITSPICFLSGTRDTLAPAEALTRTLHGLPLASLYWMEGCDHSFQTLKSLRRSAEDIWLELSERATTWLDLDDKIEHRHVQALAAAPAPSKPVKAPPAKGRTSRQAPSKPAPPKERQSRSKTTSTKGETRSNKQAQTKAGLPETRVLANKRSSSRKPSAP